MFTKRFAGELLSDFYALAVFNFHKFNDSAVFISRQIEPNLLKFTAVVEMRIYLNYLQI